VIINPNAYIYRKEYPKSKRKVEKTNKAKESK